MDWLGAEIERLQVFHDPMISSTLDEKRRIHVSYLSNRAVMRKRISLIAFLVKLKCNKQPEIVSHAGV